MDTNDRLLYDIEQFLIKNGAADYVHYFLRFNYDKIRNGEVILMLIPIDAALQRLVDKVGKSLDIISTLPEGKDILSNFLSSIYINDRYPVYTAINGTTFGKTRDDLTRLKFIAYEKIGNIFIGVIDGIINRNAQQINSLIQANPTQASIQRSNIIGDNIGTRFDDLPNPIIRMIALNLSSLDIVNNCRTSSLFNSSICDNENFWNEKVRKDFPKQQHTINGGWKNTYRTLSKKLYVLGNYITFSDRYESVYSDTIRVINDPNNITFVAGAPGCAAMISSGRLYTAGRGTYGQLGHGNSLDQHVLKLVEGLTDVTMVACGERHTAVISNRKLYTFGYGLNGQLGHGDNYNQTSPKLVEGLDNVTFVSCGGVHTAIVANGKLYTFGWGVSGRLGHGDHQDQFKPKMVEGLNNITIVVAGGAHTAAISSGRLYTFGGGESGQLGHGDRQDQLRPKLVEELDNVSFVACGADRTAAISGRRLYMCGDGHYGELGTPNKRQLRFEIIEDLLDFSIDPNGIQTTLDDVTMVACGEYRTAVISGAQLYTLGEDDVNALRDELDLEPFQWEPTLVKQLTNVTFVTVSIGFLVLAD